MTNDLGPEQGPGSLVQMDVLDALAGRKAYRTAPVLTPAERKDLVETIRTYRRSIDKLAQLAKQQPTSLEFYRVRARFFRSWTTRLCATVRALAKLNKSVSYEAIERFAQRLNVSEAIDEAIRLGARGKRDGALRPLAKYGPRRMAQQFIVRDLLVAHRIEGSSDYAKRGAGGERCFLEDVCLSIEAGDRYWLSADIKNCFPSIKPKHLMGWLPLPEKLLRNVVFVPKDAPIIVPMSAWKLHSRACAIAGEKPSSHAVNDAINAAKRTVRQGLPTGTILSPLVARAFVGRVLRSVPEADKVFYGSFVDDLALGAHEIPELLAAIEAIRTQFKSLSAGPILLTQTKMRDVLNGAADVLGYKVTTGDGYGRETHVKPARKRFERAHRKIALDIYKLGEIPVPGDFYDQVISRKIDAWLPSQQAWTKVPVYSRALCQLIARQRVCEELEALDLLSPNQLNALLQP